MIEPAIGHIINHEAEGSIPSISYRFKGSAGPSMYITVSLDEYGVVNGMFINVGSSGSTIHNVCNALARVISIAIQNDKATSIQIVQTMEDVGSEVVWICDTLGKADSIPAAIALVLLRHVKIDEKMEEIHTDNSNVHPDAQGE
jgi:hypothetical protein